MLTSHYAITLCKNHGMNVLCSIKLCIMASKFPIIFFFSFDNLISTIHWRLKSYNVTKVVNSSFKTLTNLVLWTCFQPNGPRGHKKHWYWYELYKWYIIYLHNKCTSGLLPYFQPINSGPRRQKYKWYIIVSRFFILIHIDYKYIS